MPRIPGIRKRGPTLFVLPSIPDDLPHELKDGLAIRNVASTTGKCPACDSELSFHTDETGIGHIVIAHDEGCPALLEGE